MATRSTLLKALLRERHWQKYATFCRQYDRTARKVEPTLVGTWPSRGQYARWLAGDLKGLPRPDHCRVLVALFPGVIAAATAPATASEGTDVPSGGRDGDGVRAGHAGTLSEEIIMSTEDAARFVRRAHGAVNQEVIDQLSADVRRLAADY